MKIFNCIIDDGKTVFKSLVTANNRKELLSVYGGNGSFEKIQDVTMDYLNSQSLDKLDSDLMRMQWGEGERKMIVALLEQHLKDRK